MKKLNKKLFIVICGILTLFLLSILTIFNYQDYQREYKSIENILNRMDNIHEKIDSQDFKLNNEPKPELSKSTDKKIFIDSLVYTIRLENTKVKEVISHTENGLTNDEVIDVTNNILLKANTNFKIGILYFDKYSYSLKNNVLILVDNDMAKERILSTLKISIIIFIILESIIIIVSLKLTKWIIKPVEESFFKQKQFIEDASHELKTPLAVIQANAEMIEQDDKNHKWLENIKSETDRMNKLVIDLLSLARLEKDKNEYSTVNLSKLIEKTLLPLESLMYENNIKLDYQLDDTIEYNCNQEQIKQLLVILLDNAIKHSSKKGKIIVNLEKFKNDIIIEVKNKGKAIPEEERSKIFERFYRGDQSRNRDSNRYGLGLSIAKGIVNNHNGKITILCNEGYTTFKVVLKQVQ